MGPLSSCLERRGALHHAAGKRVPGAVRKGPREAYRLPSSPTLVCPCCPDRVPMWQVYLLPDVKPLLAPPCCSPHPAAPGIQLPMTGTCVGSCAGPAPRLSSAGRGCVTQLCHSRAWHIAGALIKVCEINGHASERSRWFLSRPNVLTSSERISVPSKLLLGKGNVHATIPITVPFCRGGKGPRAVDLGGQRTAGELLP